MLLLFSACLSRLLYLFLQSQSSCQTSLLGDPPKEVKLPSNPYLNLASVLPGVVLQGTCTIRTAHTEDDSFLPVLGMYLFFVSSLFSTIIFTVYDCLVSSCSRPQPDGLQPTPAEKIKTVCMRDVLNGCP